MKKRVEIARDVIAGYYGSGDKRSEALKKAGYDPDVVQGDVNTLLCCRENIINNIMAMAVSIANNNNWWYILWTAKYGHECAICHPHNGENHGWQCIGFHTGRASIWALSRATRIASTLALGSQSVCVDSATWMTPAAPPTAPVTMVL